MYILENKNIILRALEPEDLDILFEIENNRDLWMVSNTLTPFSRDLLKKYIDQSHLDIYEAKQLRLVISSKETAKVMGLVDLFDFDPHHLRVGIGISVLPSHQRRGIAKQSIEIMLNYAFDQLGLHQVYANIPTKNEKSRNLFKNIGFNCTGSRKEWIRLNDEYLDVEIYQYINPTHL